MHLYPKKTVKVTSTHDGSAPTIRQSHCSRTDRWSPTPSSLLTRSLLLHLVHNCCHCFAPVAGH